jgi:hypothetical protein
VTPSLAQTVEGGWAVYPLAWPVEKVVRMQWSAQVVRGWLEADGATGLGMANRERLIVRERAMADGLTSTEAWLVYDALRVGYRRLQGPGARVQERARRVVMAAQAVQEGQKASEGPRRRFWAGDGSGHRSGGFRAPEAVQVANLGLSEATAYAREHAWGVGDAGVVVEDVPWSGEGLGEALPVGWWGLIADPARFGVEVPWRSCMWRFGSPRPMWTHDAGLRSRLFVGLRSFHWNEVPLRADMDEIEDHLPVVRSVNREGAPLPTAWLVPGVEDVGWALAWPTPVIARARPSEVEPATIRA